jgi:D-amino-acid dehydrogenase
MQHVIVIGGGVVGLTSAWWLAEAGFRVTILERREHVGQGASFANGGQLSYRYVAPLADAGVPLKALQWLMQQDGPLRFRLEADSRQWRWLAQFLKNCNATTNRRTTATLLKLGALSKAAMASLHLPDAAADFGWREAGKLVVYRSRQVFDAAVARPDVDKLRQVLTPVEAIALEPALAAMLPVLTGAIFTPGEAVADCHAFCQLLEQRLLQHPRFEGVLHGTAQRLITRNGNGKRAAGSGPVRAGGRHPEPRPGRHRRHPPAAVSAQGVQSDSTGPPTGPRARYQRDRFRTQSAICAHRPAPAHRGDGRYGGR